MNLITPDEIEKYVATGEPLDKATEHWGPAEGGGATGIGAPADPRYCEPSVFSHYTSSFSWAESNFSAIWLRSSYLLLDHAFLSDIQVLVSLGVSPGVTMAVRAGCAPATLPRICSARASGLLA